MASEAVIQDEFDGSDAHMSTLSYLKRETQPLHDEVEGNRYNVHLMRGDLPLERYICQLNSLLAVHRSLDEVMSDAADGLTAAVWRDDMGKVGLLERDLRELEESQPDALWAQAALHAAGDFVGAIEKQQHPARRLGYLYVIEGSTMGGIFISKRLREVYGLADDSLHYHSAYGKLTRRRWEAFRERFDDAVCMQVERDHALAGATDGFRRFGRIFEALSMGLNRV